MADYKAYLAAGVLTEDKVITYRLLSRALKVHVNTAKGMLYEFYRQQNAKKPGTVHATYLLSGTKLEAPKAPTPTITKDGEDEYMQSSPFVASSMPEQEEVTPVFTTTIALVREEDLDSMSVKSQYENITSIHIYSIGPHPLKDLHVLSDITREIQVLTVSEDPLEHNATYGTIVNPLVKRRQNRRPPPAAAAKTVAPVAKPKSVESANLLTKTSTATKQEGTASQSAATKDFFGKGKEKSKAASESGPGSKESTPAPPAKLKKESSSIFKSFAKTPKVKRENAAEDVSMKGMDDDDDDEEETYVPPVQVKKEKVTGAEESAGDRKSRKEREAALKQMMEESDEEEVVPTPETEEEEVILEKEVPAAEPEPVTTVSGGRRRGKRRLMQKKTVKDDEGYLVTKEEAVWESFSEDEPIAPVPKPKVPAVGSVKGKKGTAKPGQGNIMSFFGKKA